MLDKGYKVHTIGMRIREYGGGYTMMVDADDLQSNRIAEYVNKHPNENGFLSHNGYYWHVGDNYIKKGHKFPNGSSTIVKYSVEDLPDKYYDKMQKMKLRHSDRQKLKKKKNWPLFKKNYSRKSRSQETPKSF